MTVADKLCFMLQLPMVPSQTAEECDPAAALARVLQGREGGCGHVCESRQVCGLLVAALGAQSGMVHPTFSVGSGAPLEWVGPPDGASHVTPSCQASSVFTVCLPPAPQEISK